MLKRFYQFLLFVFVPLLLVDCARRGRPDGGPKDEDAPVMVTASPPYETINFSSKEIKIYFDEYIVLKGLTKQLVVSPPLKNPPIITPQGMPSKYINIKILDTLKENTTYIFNFGNAVQDNNENNKLESFKYVFSTGKYIDSLNLQGTVKDVFKDQELKGVNLGLYRLDTTFNDSIVFKKKPNYIANTLDSTVFNFTNLRKGKYLLLALKEENSDYIFNPVTDKIGFVPTIIDLPKDSVLTNSVILFKEEQPFKFKRAREVSRGKIQFGFSGIKDSFKVKLLSNVDSSFRFQQQFEKDKDTLNFWFEPNTQDSLNFLVSNSTFIDTVTVRLRKKKIDSLLISSSVESYLNPLDTFYIKANNPIAKVDISKISIIDKDTMKVDFKKLRLKNKIALLFENKFEQQYSVTLLPNALSDLFNQKNDTLNFNFSTRKEEDYGSILLDVKNLNNKNLIIQLLSNNKILKNVYIKGSQKIEFTYLDPQNYTVRAIVDSNKDREWTTGNFLKRLPPEDIIYFPKEIKLRANWTNNEILVIK